MTKHAATTTVHDRKLGKDVTFIRAKSWVRVEARPTGPVTVVYDEMPGRMEYDNRREFTQS